MKRRPVQDAVRRQRRTDRLGPDAACALCGVRTPEALIVVDRSLLERHHVVGRANDGDLTVPVCRNCHAVLTEGQLAHGVPLSRPRSDRERIANGLHALGAFLPDLGKRLSEWSDNLRKGLNE